MRRTAATLVSVATGDAELEALRGEMSAMRAEMRELRELLMLAAPRPMKLSREDRGRIAKVLPAIAGARGSELFATRELFESAAPALRIALERENPKRLGRLLHRAVGAPIDGLTVRAEGRELNSTLWRILRVDEFLSL